MNILRRRSHAYSYSILQQPTLKWEKLRLTEFAESHPASQQQRYGIGQTCPRELVLSALGSLQDSWPCSTAFSLCLAWRLSTYPCHLRSPGCRSHTAAAFSISRDIEISRVPALLPDWRCFQYGSDEKLEPGGSVGLSGAEGVGQRAR